MQTNGGPKWAFPERRTYLRLRGVKTKVLLGPVDPTIRYAIEFVCSQSIELEHADCRGYELLQQARSRGIDIVITSKDEASDLCGEASSGMLLLGVSTASWVVVWCDGENLRHLSNPLPETIPALIEDWRKVRRRKNLSAPWDASP